MLTQILTSLEENSARTEKENILTSNKDNVMLQRVLSVATDPYITFGVKKIKGRKKIGERQLDDPALTEFLDILDKLSKRELTGNAAKDRCVSFLGEFDEEGRKWLERILYKNLRCGISEKTINKIWPELIKTFKVQLAHTLDATSDIDDPSNLMLQEDLEFPVLVEPKLDGLRCVAIKHEGEVSLFTRNGNEITTLPKITKELEALQVDNVVFDGEAMGEDWNESASIIRSEKNKKDDKNIFYWLFDCIPLEDWMVQQDDTPLETRRVTLRTIFNLAEEGSNLRLVEQRVINNVRELTDYYVECLDRGFEGVMIKNPNRGYDFKRSKAILKLKPEATYEGVIVGSYTGNVGTKREGRFTGFQILLPNGVITECASGLSDDFKEKTDKDGADQYLGKIIEVVGQPPLTKDGRIRFPRLIGKHLMGGIHHAGPAFRDPSDVDPAVVLAYEKWKEANG